MNFLKSLETWFEEKFGWLSAFLKPVASAIVAAGGPILVSAAEQAVAAVEKDPSIIGSAAKRDAAFNQILSSLKGQGLTAGASVINAAIELAVQGLQAATGG